MYPCGKPLCVPQLSAVRYPELVGQIDSPFEAPTEQQKINELARLDRCGIPDGKGCDLSRDEMVRLVWTRACEGSARRRARGVI